MALGVSRAEPAIDFARDIRSLLTAHCYDCHGPEKAKSGLRLTTRASAFAGGDSGEPVIVPGQSSQSAMIQRLTSTDEEEMMPQKGDRLAPDEVALLARWIDTGAEWPDEAPHWAYMKPVRPPVPSSQHADARPLNPIDHFILARLAAEGLAPAPPADKARWLRRVSLDLIGLPPTPAEVDTFLAETGEEAFARAVDRLLASPHYGERWARPGRDHHKEAFTMWLAGGGAKPGVTFGRTDDFGYGVVENPVHVHDLNATLLHLLGLDHERLTYRYQGRDFRLTDVHGRIVHDLLA